jgi:hypothetical protein
VTTDDTVVHCGVPTARLKIPASGSVRMTTGSIARALIDGKKN